MVSLDADEPVQDCSYAAFSMDSSGRWLEASVVNQNLAALDHPNRKTAIISSPRFNGVTIGCGVRNDVAEEGYGVSRVPFARAES
jgi:hypothetical protein